MGCCVFLLYICSMYSIEGKKEGDVVFEIVNLS